MKALKAYEVTAIVIETDSIDWPIFKRYSADNWENLMGESWEPVGRGEDDLESMYQDWLRDEEAKKKFQYFYRQDECRAKSAGDDRCICWHDEGAGPHKNEKHDDKNTMVEWRIK